MPIHLPVPMTLLAIWIAAVPAGAALLATPPWILDPQRVAIPQALKDSASDQLVVRVVAMDQRSRKGKPVASVDIAVGFGCAYAPESPVQATGTTDSEGRVDVKIPWSLVSAARSSGECFWVRPTGAGWMGQTRRMGITEIAMPEEVRVLAQPGFTAYGQLLDQDGAPVRGSIDVRAIAVDAAKAFGHGSACDHGRFELHVTHEGTYGVMANAYSPPDSDQRSRVDESIGVLQAVRVDADDLGRNLELKLAGSGIVRGRVQTSAGQPVAGLDLSLGLSSLTELQGTQAASFRSYQELRWEGVGGCGGRVRTAEDGSFEVRGLRDDRFQIREESRRGLLTPVGVVSDGNPLLLVLDHPHLVVRVLDEMGAPWSADVAGTACYSTRFPDDWPASPRLVLTPTRGSLVDAGWQPYPPNSLPRGQESESGTISYDVLPGWEYMIEILGGNSHCAPRPIRVPIRPGRMDVALQLGPAPGFGTVSLSAPDMGATRAVAVVVRIEERTTGRLVYRAEDYVDQDWSLQLKVPAGDHRLAVEGRSTSLSCSGVISQSCQWGLFETNLSLAVGEVTPVKVHLPAGARIDLTLIGEAEESDRLKIGEGWRGAFFQNVEYLARRAECRLIAPGRMPRTVEFTYRETGSGASGTYLGIHIPVGTRQTSEIVPAGNYTLVARMPGGRTASSEVFLIDGQTTQVKLTLPR